MQRHGLNERSARRARALIHRVLGLCLMAAALSLAQTYTRGVGIYPGAPREDFSPTLAPDRSGTYRNLALLRPAYQSSSYDFNLTAQLVTDGLKASEEPRWLRVSTSRQGELSRKDRESVLDGNFVTDVSVSGNNEWIQFQLGGGPTPLEVTRIELDGSLHEAETSDVQPQEWAAVVLTSDDGRNWTRLGHSAGMAPPTGEFHPKIEFDSTAHQRWFRIEFPTERALSISINEVRFYDNAEQLHLGGPFYFTSAWKSAGNNEEWIYVDLGTRCSFDRVILAWIKPAAEAKLQTSDDSVTWQDLQTLTPPDSSGASDIKLSSLQTARYVRVLMSHPASPEGYVLSEMEVYGRGGLLPQSKSPPAAYAGKLHLSGGHWRLQRASQVEGSGEAISQPGFPDENWLVATVPATVLSSYLNAGALPDPNFADNQLAISDSFFYSDFWYRDEFTVPPSPALPARHFWLNFKGINWKAEVYLNGMKLGSIEGGFMRAHFDITKLLHPGATNVLAVRIIKNDTPGSVHEKTLEEFSKNGGALGADNPTYDASIGWDWIPTIRGRNTGIWSDVFLSESGPITLDDPSLSSLVNNQSTADVTLSVRVQNHENIPVNGSVRGLFGDLQLAQPFSLTAGESKLIQFNPANQPRMHMENPKLWWPNGYGEPTLHRVELRAETRGSVISDQKSFQAGIRQFTYSQQNGALKMFINGRRLVPRGGSWGFSESMLRYRAREYDAAVRYHRDQHFNIIRNWVGQIGDDAFYDACDRYGIVVWQDFWLANPWDGPDPNSQEMFLANLRDTVLRIRAHPSIGIYVGRNEGFPSNALENGIRDILAKEHPDIQYIPSSADGVVSGHGPYGLMPLKYYFEQRATPKMHSELGMPNIVTLDSLKQMMPETAMWPQGRIWGVHDFTLTGAPNGTSFRAVIDKTYGGAKSLDEWLTLAQFVNYDGYRAMFEAQSKNRMGLLIWMSHPAWPSLVWQTYDFYLDPTAAYFAVKKASEPLHIQWNPLTDNVEVVNYSVPQAQGLSAKIELLNLDGTMKWSKSASVNSTEDSTLTPIHIELPAGLSSVFFMRLQLTRGNEIISRNLYWRGSEEGNLTVIRNVPEVTIHSVTKAEKRGSHWLLTTNLTNTSQSAPAIMVHLKAVGTDSGDRILPAIYADNYVTLMPGETQSVATDILDADTRGEKPKIVIEGFNVSAAH